MMQGKCMAVTPKAIYHCNIWHHCVRDDAQSKKMALKEKTEKEITQYNMELKVNCCVHVYIERKVFLGVCNLYSNIFINFC